MRRGMHTVLSAALLLAGYAATASVASAQGQTAPNYPGYQLSRFYYYPYIYYPHNYWPVMSPRWPEAPGAPYMRPPGYMAYPAFREPNWRYDLWNSQRYYRGSHFWLDQF